MSKAIRKYTSPRIQCSITLRYDWPSSSYYMVHRADFSRLLAARACEYGVTVHFQAQVASIEESRDQTILKLEDGSVFQSDILIGADGESRCLPC